ncbi:ATP-dependent Clp protease ATP-binding subunit [bacterium]|nr:ATP-dependent Clp protease ATP-binding subunit [bacterium]
MLKSEISKKLTAHAKRSLQEAEEIARYCDSKTINPEHLLFAIYLEKGSLGNNLLEEMKIKRNVFDKMFPPKHRKKSKKIKVKPEFSSQLKSTVTRAYNLASQLNSSYVGTEHLVQALMESPDKNIRKIFHSPEKTSRNENEIANFAKNNMSDDPMPNLLKLFNLSGLPLKKDNYSDNDNTPYLDKFCSDLNKDAQKNSYVIIGREKEMERIINILGRKNKNNPVLIGDPGVGKTAIAEGLAQKINSGKVPPRLLDKKILNLDMALLVAGTSFRGEFEERLKEIISETKRNKNIILFIDEIHTIVGAGNISGGLDAANILKPALSRGDIQCVGATTIEEYKKYIEKDPALERRFQPVKISEPAAKETEKIINGIKRRYEKFHSVTIEPEAIKQAVNLSIRYIQDRFLPDKAIDVVDEAASCVRRNSQFSILAKKLNRLKTERDKVRQEKNNLVGAENYEKAAMLKEEETKLNAKIKLCQKKQRELEKQNPAIITKSDIVRIISRMAGIPLKKLSRSKFGKFKNLKRNLNARVIGQEETIEKIIGAVLRSQSGISSPERPLGSFLFLGPTGVGKTLTAKTLARELFENSQSLVRIDMSEFMERHSVARLLGSPAGYVGYGEGGKLTEKIRRQPYSLILFDEIEKAHPDVFNILLQILEEGILTDAEGRAVNFKNTFIILTSNLGTAKFTQAGQIGFGSDREKKASSKFNFIKNKVLEELKKQVKPEFLNRLDHIAVFKALGKAEIKKITRLEMKKLKNRLSQQGKNLTYSEKVISLLSRKSLDLEQGARTVRKNIQELAENKIAEALINNKIKNRKIKLDVKEKKIIVR